MSLITVLAIVLSLNTAVFAEGTHAAHQNSASIHAVVEQIDENIPNATVRVIGNTIHVVVDDQSDIATLFGSGTEVGLRTTSVVSSAGGSYRDFTVPWYSTVFPYSQIYMSKDAVDALKLKLTEPTFCNWVREQISGGVAAAAIVAAAKAVWGISITTGVATLLGGLFAWVTSNMEYWSLDSAQANSTGGKASVVRFTTTDGNHIISYAPWNDSSCPSYLGYDATWYGGEYDV